MIEVKNLSRVYNKGKQNEVRACDDISIKLEDTGFYVIFGKSGAGKSSFMNALGGLDNYSAGTIEYDGQVFKKMVSDKCRIANIGYIFQNYCLDAELNVYDNVALGLRSVGIRDEEIIFNRTMTALANVGMAKYFRRSVTTLSGGQQQRVAIARAMAKGSKIILADEPTGNLDDENTRVVMNILKEMSKTRMVIVVTHEVDIVETYADKIIEIHDGKIVNESTGLSKEYVSEDKNHVFLSDLNKETVELGGITVEKYGDDVPINIKVVNVDGKLYLEADNANLKIIDNKSEIKLIDSTREEYKQKMKEELGVKLKDLEPIEPKSSGKVFRFKDCAVKKNDQSRKTQKRNKFLKVSLSLLVIVILLVSGAWGASYNNVAIGVVDNTAPTVNFAIENIDQYNKVMTAVSSSVTNVAFTRYDEHMSYGDMLPRMEPFSATYKPIDFESKVDPNAVDTQSTVYINVARKKDVDQCIAGEKVDSKDNVVITTGFLDATIASIAVNNRGFRVDKNKYIQDSIGSYIDITAGGYTGTKLRVSGVVDSPISMVYVNDSIYCSIMDINQIYGARSHVELLEAGEKFKARVYVAEDDPKPGYKEEVIVAEDTIYLPTYNVHEAAPKDVQFIVDGAEQVLHVVYVDRITDNEEERMAKIMTSNTLNKFGGQIFLTQLLRSEFGSKIMVGVSLSVRDAAEVAVVNDAVKSVIADEGEDTKMAECLTSIAANEQMLAYAKEQLGIMNIVNVVMLGMIILISALVIFANFTERTKEVGIYRAIGVSKSNLVFKYFAENLKTVIVHVLIVILIVGGLLMLASYFPLDPSNPMLNGSMMFLAWWQLLGIIAVIIPVLMLISIIPPLGYMRRSPIQILSEYDM